MANGNDVSLDDAIGSSEDFVGSANGSRPGNIGIAEPIGQNQQSANDPGKTANGAPVGVTKKSRGRQPYPRDAEGNIIRPDGSKSPGNKKEKLVLGGFKPNDRAAFRGNVQGLHAAAAAFTRQPVFALTPQEADALTKATCDVLDYHKINATDAAGAMGLYVTLIAVSFAIYQPRVMYLRSQRAQNVSATAPADAQEAVFGNGVKMNFEESTVQ